MYFWYNYARCVKISTIWSCRDKDELKCTLHSDSLSSTSNPYAHFSAPCKIDIQWKNLTIYLYIGFRIVTGPGRFLFYHSQPALTQLRGVTTLLKENFVALLKRRKCSLVYGAGLLREGTVLYTGRNALRNVLLRLQSTSESGSTNIL